MTLETITRKLQAQAEKLGKSSLRTASTFTLCGTRCRIWYGYANSQVTVHYGYKRPLMQGFEPCTVDALASHLHRFQF